MSKDELADAIDYVQNKNRAMEKDDYASYDDNLKKVVKAARSWQEHLKKNTEPYRDPEQPDWFNDLSDEAQQKCCDYIKALPEKGKWEDSGVEDVAE